MYQRGFNFLEMLIVLAIAGTVMAIAVPDLQSMIVSARTRGVADSIQSGLLLARSEAIKRNALMRFQLVSTMTSACATTATSRLWVVTQFTGATTPSNTRGEPWGRCHIAGYSPPDQEEPCPTTPAYVVDTAATPPTAASCTADPFIAYKSSTETAANIDVAATPASVGALSGFVITFGPLGQLVANFDGTTTQAATAATIAVGPSVGVAGRRYRVTVSANGSIRLCNPDLPVGDAMAC